MPVLVSACMIVKNESTELPLALESLGDLVDEIVIYDTGSTDDTIAIARAAGAIVIEGYWDDDFARARNACLEHCSGEWILWLDADESIHGDFTSARRQLEENGNCDGYLIAIESLEGVGLAGHVTFHACRLFRRSICHWWSPIHEQVVCRSDGTLPEARYLADLRILHRGYVNLARDSAAKIERNLRLARLALDAPDVDRPYALFNLGRTLMRSDHPEEGIEALREAAELTTNRTLQQHSLDALARLYLMLEDYKNSLATIGRLRSISSSGAAADGVEALLHLRRADFARCLDVLDRMAYLEVDDAGIEHGRHTSAWVRARALYGLRRPGDAADVLLDVLATHGILDEPIELLISYLTEADKPIEEIARALRPESVAVFCASTSSLPLPVADRLLSAIAERFPDRLEPIAVASTFAAQLPITRALWWSAAMRRHSQEERCPLIAIGGDESLESIVRLRALAAAFGSFGDQRALDLARGVIAGLDPVQASAALADISPLSSRLIELIVEPGASRALHLSFGDIQLPGYLNCAIHASSNQLSLDLAHLPFATESLHDIVVRDVLATVGSEALAPTLFEFFRVATPGGRLEVHVPNVAYGLAALSDAGLEDARELLYGAHGQARPYANAWTPEALLADLALAGFDGSVVRSDNEIVVEARRIGIDRQRGGDAMVSASVVVLARNGADRLLDCLRNISANSGSDSYEVIIVDVDHDERVAELLGALSGDLCVIRPDRAIDAALAFSLALSEARSETMVVVADTVRVEPGWLRALTAEAIGGATVSSAVVIDSGRVVAAGLDLSADRARRIVVADARTIVDRERPPTALGPWCFAASTVALRSVGGMRPGYDSIDGAIDLSLRLSSAGLSLSVEPGCVVLGSGLPQSQASSRALLAARWSRRVQLPALRTVAPNVTRLLPSTTLVDRVSANSRHRIAPLPMSGGVNLVGDFFTPTSSMRASSIRDALADRKERVATLAYRDGHLETSPEDEAQLPFATTLLCFDGEGLVAYASTVGLDAFRDRFTIGSWHYPMAEPLADTTTFAAMVAEIWAPSEFSRRALELATNRAVYTMAPPIVPVARGRQRHVELPDTFVFATGVRCDSAFPGTMARANPFGTITAFSAAFREGQGPALYVRLRGSRARAVGEECRHLSAGRSDIIIHVVSGDDDRVPVVANADCYVSLHRSSAFSPGLARAAASGLPVIATAYGGPMDYLESAGGYLVEHRIVAVGPDRLPHPADETWAEPDIDDAARAFAEIWRDPIAARARAAKGATFMAGRYSPANAGAAMAARLSEIDGSRDRVASANQLSGRSA